MATVLPEHKLRLNYKGFDPAWIDADSPIPPDFPSLPENRFIGMFLGNSKGRPHKGLEVLIQAFHRVRDPESILIVLGSFSAEAEQLAEDGPANARIFLIGEVNNATEWLRHAGLYIQPTLLKEGLPRSVKEAMALALPVIITDIPGSTELIEHGKSGLVVQANNADDLALAWERMAANPGLRQQFGSTAKARLQSEFTPEAFVQNTLRAYSEVLNLRPRK